VDFEVDSEMVDFEMDFEVVDFENGLRNGSGGFRNGFRVDFEVENEWIFDPGF
jgi:hypothetical protein